MGNNKKKSKPNSNGHRSRNGNARVAADAFVRPRERSSSQRSSSQIVTTEGDLRTYSIPDYRLEHPNFTVHQSADKDGRVRYEVSGDLDAPVPPIRDSKDLTKQQAIDALLCGPAVPSATRP